MITITLPEWIATVIGILVSITLFFTIISIFLMFYRAIQQWLEDRADDKRYGRGENK